MVSSLGNVYRSVDAGLLPGRRGGDVAARGRPLSSPLG